MKLRVGAGLFFVLALVAAGMSLLKHTCPENLRGQMIAIVLVSAAGIVTVCLPSGSGKGSEDKS